MGAYAPSSIRKDSTSTYSTFLLGCCAFFKQGDRFSGISVSGIRLNKSIFDSAEAGGVEGELGLLATKLEIITTVVLK